MASGTLGRQNLQKDQPTVLYTCPNELLATASINICNRGASETFIFISISDTDSHDDSGFIEFNTILPPFGVLERTGVVVSQNKRIIVTAETDDVSAVAYGFEDVQ